ncbi:ExeM/NucH family extracellular endonuclease [Cupriavidus pinatubonensis]|uniref:ExeM/NucH family extracellular endonuclease n=1 Tax=Cupriavidus pinatubonensis TaxID=248026 RepID=UPI001C730D17|nr:ExeM/NucH family extracellular endonuclease [Cupriavidus pinatubonensis]QYY28610.1 ExeM/NucH family extracellular endonuclease [Cupriavidus pinatubonensis]
MSFMLPNPLLSGLLLAASTTLAVAATAPCGSPSTLIADVQGASTTSPLAGRTVEIEAVVTADFSGPDGFMGFFAQQEDARRQHRPGVSEGLFVYAPRHTARAGDLMRLPGTVEERYGQTQLALSGMPVLCATGRTVTPASMTMPFADEAALAAREGMLVSLPQTLTVNDTHELGRYGSLLLGHGRLRIPTAVAAPGRDAAQLAAANALNRLVLDDGSSQQTPEVVPYPAPALSTANPVRAGDTVSGVRGVLEKRYGTWRLQPVPGDAPPRFTATNPRHAAPARTGGTDVRVAAFNVLNYFNGNGQGGGFNAPDNRGARNTAEFDRQEAKLLAALHALDADVIGLMEVENNGYGPHSAVQRLAALMGPGWRAVDPGTPRLGTDAIAVALLYNQRAVKPVGMPATTVLDMRNRQPLAQTFQLIGNLSQTFTVVVNHLKSKGCADADGTDRDQGDGQGCWNATRSRAARALADWLGTSPTGVANAGKLVIGDLNSYASEDPLTVLAREGYEDIVARFAGRDAYTYVFDGRAGYLDYALADAALVPRIRAVSIWHVNADEPVAFAYAQAYRNAAQQERYYAPDAWRASDHDPVLVDLSWREAAPDAGRLDASPRNGIGAAEPDGGGGSVGLAALLGIMLAACATLAAPARQTRQSFR